MDISLFSGLMYIVGGISLFFLGMNFFSNGVGNMVKKRKHLLTKLDALGRFGYYLGGVFSTAIIQSSDATTILAMNLSEENVIDKSKALSLSFGARLGTTITALLATLSELNISTIFIGITLPLALLFPKKRPNVKSALLGFGLFFSGLLLLKLGTAESENYIKMIFSHTGSSFLLFLLGLLITAIFQSSSATSSILVILTATGVIDIQSALFVYIGATVGTTATPIIVSIKLNDSAKFIAQAYSLSALVIGLISMSVFNFCVDRAVSIIAKIPNSLQLATFGIFYSFISSIISLLLQKPFEWISGKIIDLMSIRKYKKPAK